MTEYFSFFLFANTHTFQNWFIAQVYTYWRRTYYIVSSKKPRNVYLFTKTNILIIISSGEYNTCTAGAYYVIFAIRSEWKRFPRVFDLLFILVLWLPTAAQSTESAKSNIVSRPKFIRLPCDHIFDQKSNISITPTRPVPKRRVFFFLKRTNRRLILLLSLGEEEKQTLNV